MGCVAVEYEGIQKMTRKKYLYHTTKPEKVASIISEGLKRSASDRTTFAVYLSEQPLSWWQEGISILKVDISGLAELKASTFLPESDEVLFWGDIPAYKLTKNGYINRITDVTDKYLGGRKERR